MFTILIIICLLQLWLIFGKCDEFKDVRVPLIKAMVLVFGLIFFNTELLSALSLLTFRGIFSLWLLENLSCSGILYYMSDPEKPITACFKLV